MRGGAMEKLEPNDVMRMQWPGLRRAWSLVNRRHEARKAEKQEYGETKTAASSGKLLEHTVLRAFQLSGATASPPFQVWVDPDTSHPQEEIDGAIHLGARSFLVECKDTRANISVEPIAKLQSQLRRRPPGVFGIVFSRLSFTASARYTATFGAATPVLSWPGVAIESALRSGDFAGPLEARIRHFAEQSLPYLDADEEEIVKEKRVVRAADHRDGR